MTGIDPLMAGVRQYLRELPDDQFSDLVQTVRLPADPANPAAQPAPAAPLAPVVPLRPAVDESNLPITRRSDFRSKVDRLAQLAAEANPTLHAVPTPAPPPVDDTPSAPTGFSVNRAQGASGSGGPPPETERSRNSRLIGDLLKGQR